MNMPIVSLFTGFSILGNANLILSIQSNMLCTELMQQFLRGQQTFAQEPCSKFHSQRVRMNSSYDFFQNSLMFRRLRKIPCHEMQVAQWNRKFLQAPYFRNVPNDCA